MIERWIRTQLDKRLAQERMKLTRLQWQYANLYRAVAQAKKEVGESPDNPNIDNI